MSRPRACDGRGGRLSAHPQMQNKRPMRSLPTTHRHLPRRLTGLFDWPLGQRRRGSLKARLVRFAAGRARALMALRESPKFFAVRLFALIRAKLFSVGQELAAAGDLGAGG